MGKRLDAKLTPVPFRNMTHALTRCWQKLSGDTPSRESLAVLLAQSALETGHWKTSYCYNLGNAKAGPSWTGDYCFYHADEIVSPARAAQAFAERMQRTDGVSGHNVELTPLGSGQTQVTLYPDHSWCRFRAFTALDAGAEDYLGLLRRRFERAWPAVVAGNPEQFVRTLHELGYFTASVERYLPPVMKLYAQFSASLAKPEAPEPVAVPVTLPVSPAGRPTLRQGARGAAVSEVQRILISMGYAGVQETGVFDQATLHAVELFQLQHIDQKGLALKSDGEVGPKTWWALLNPSGDAQRTFLPAPSVTGLTVARQKLLAFLDAEHAKPVFEVPDGSNRSPDIDRYFGDTGVRGQPWCCAFVSFALKTTLGQLPIGGTYHLGVQRMWVAAQNLGFSEANPKPGDVFIQIKSGGTGHTGFVVGVSLDGQTIYTCEGNCGNRVKYGQRPKSSIHHFIDVIRDGQRADFPRGATLDFDDVGTDGTR